MGLPAAQVNGVVADLTALLGDRCTIANSILEHHGHDESYHHPSLPDAVCFAHSTEEVSEIVKICSVHNVPIIPYGVGTSLEGHVIPENGGVTVDLSQMNEVLEVNEEDLDCVVQPGVTRKQLNEYLRATGLFFPIDPGADASIGGMTATRASGTNAVRYGTMRENVLSLTVVMADGRIIRTNRRARKSSAGYDLTRLMVGSEGTLGIITEITLRLYGIPEAISSAVVSFDNLAGAVDTTILTIQSGVPVARIELLDEVQMAACNKYSDLDYPDKPTLFLEFHGTDASVQEQAEMVGALCEEYGGSGFQWTTKAEERNKLWQARHDAAYAAKALKPQGQIWATDVCVPISRLTECIVETKKDIEKNGLTAPIVGHVGDGNFHLAFVWSEGDNESQKLAEEVNDRMVMRALAMGGTCTGEHGVGSGKKHFLIAEHGDAVSVMREIKKALDPQNIFNPGKIFSV